MIKSHLEGGIISVFIRAYGILTTTGAHSSMLTLHYAPVTQA
jgi:hypothetical protein